MNILVTGGTGFLGRRLIRRLADEGHRPIVLKRSTSDTSGIEDLLTAFPPYDLDKVSLHRPFQDCGSIDAVIHTAASYGRNGESPSELMAANCLFPLRLLEAAARHGVGHFINTDTALPGDVNAYALSKQQFAEWGGHCAARRGIRFVNIRLEHMYGPGDDASKFVTRLIRQCLADETDIPLTPGGQRRDFIYIDDVVSAYAALLKRGLTDDGGGFRQLELGSGQTVTIRELAELVRRATRSGAALKFGALPYRAGEPMESKADICGFLRLGWVPKTGLAAGIEKTVAAEKTSRQSR